MSTSSHGDRLVAVRGATTCDRDTRDAILEATSELLRELLAVNGVEPRDVISVIFTATPDLHAAFPALAARRLGLDRVPLLCAQEMDVPGAPVRCIRVLMHLYAQGSVKVRPVYLHGAKDLRSDL